jgi:hypothetical protein
MDMLKFIVDINLSRNSFLFSILLAQKNYSNRLMRLFCFVLFFVGEEKFTLGSFGHELQTPIHIYQNLFVFFFRLNESRYILRSCAPEIYGDDYTRVVFWLAISK